MLHNEKKNKHTTLDDRVLNNISISELLFSSVERYCLLRIIVHQKFRE